MPEQQIQEPQNIILRVLHRIATDKGNTSVEYHLNGLIGKIHDLAESHLVKVREFMEEFDDHSINHANAVLDNMADLIGKEKVEKLSVYDLFILAASAYMHDMGMALSAYEKKVLELAEKEALPVPVSNKRGCRQWVDDNKQSIFGDYLPNALEVPFLPKKDNDMFKYMAELYYDYQSFRNIYTEKYRLAKKEDDSKKNLDEKDKVVNFNKTVRTEFIRVTHPQRSAKYISYIAQDKSYVQNDNDFSQLLESTAQVAQSHGEDPKCVRNDLETERTYALVDKNMEKNRANLQFASMILRLGDIIHFTFDRAPTSLRNETLFNSDYSRKQWLYKEGVNNEITKKGQQTVVVFQNDCKTPQAYCFLKSYISDINKEIDLFNSLQTTWDPCYQIPLSHVDDKILPWKKSFETRPDLTFTLNQNRIIELLMGVELYSDPYTCFRELYQNSLDACRCVIARRKNMGEEMPQCTIEFGVKKDEGGEYIYCLDDGKGMSKYIIEHYFLNIGSSYYKSKDFYAEWAKNNRDFTPTSQFGIGILSCFMIGDRLEVITKEYEGKDGLIYFGVDGPQETFYYWNNDKIDSEDKEIFDHRLSGTLVKVYLKDEYANDLDDSKLEKKDEYANDLDDGKLEKLELLKCMSIRGSFLEHLNNFDPSKAQYDDEKRYVNLFKRWLRHIYKKIFDFVQIPFDNIKVQVSYANGTIIHPIEPRPYIAKADLSEYEKDKEMFNKYLWVLWKRNDHSVSYPILIKKSNYQFHSMLCLPTKEDADFDYNEYKRGEICVDGVRIGDIDDLPDSINYIVNRLSDLGIFNFVGKNKPPIKVDRCSFVNKVQIDDIEQLCSDYVEEVIRITKEHLETNNLIIGPSFYQKIWKWVIRILPDDRLQLLMTNCFDNPTIGYPQIESEVASVYFGEQMTLPKLMQKESIEFSNDRIFPKSDVFLLKKLSTIKSVTSATLEQLKLEFNTAHVPPYQLSKYGMEYMLIGIPEDVGLYKDYDIVAPYYPLASHRLAESQDPSRINNQQSCLFALTDVIYIIRSCRDNIHLFDRRGDYSYRDSRDPWRKLKSLKILNKYVDVYKMDGSYRKIVESEDFSFVSVFVPPIMDNADHSNEGVTIIFPHEVGRDIALVIEGRLTRSEMTKIVSQVLK